MKIISVLFLAIAIATVTACGGGSGSDSSQPAIANPPPTGGIGRTGLAMGPITTFGSIVVNGVRYETNSATFSINDAPGTQMDLSVGQVVIVRGTLNDDLVTGTADEVIFDDNVKGPVQNIDLLLNQLVVLGQVVQLGPETSFDDSISPASIDGLTVGDIVEVSGLVDANGTVSATRIELKPAGTVFEVHGLVNSLDTASSMFMLGNLLVDYSSATLNDFPGGQISNGDPVEAKGASLGSSGELLATEVEFESPGVTGNVDDHFEIEGFISRFVDAGDFDVAGIPVTTTGSTVFEGGVATDLGLNVKVEVEGDLDANGVIVADKVEIRRAKSVRAVALVDSVDSANNSLRMLGITITVDSLTRFEDKSNADVDPLTLGDINAGDYLEIRGAEMPAGSGQVLAALVEREDADTETILQGFVQSVSDPTLTILGVTITSTGTTVFRDTNGTVMSAAAFFAAADINSLVKAKGTKTGDTAISATELEFELED